MKEDLLLRWLTTDPEAYDRMVGDHQMAAYVATIDAPLLAACQGRVLELACGTGRLLRLLDARPEVQQVVGLDIAPRMLAAAAARGHRLLVQASAEALPFSPGHFDTVLCAVYTLRDLEDVRAEVAALKRAGLRLREISSVRFLPFLRGRIHPGYWHGGIGALFG